MENVTITGKANGMIVGRFGGAFAAFSRAVFIDLTAAGFAAKLSQLMAMDYGADLGNAMREDSKLASKVSKANADGECRIRLSGQTSAVKMSPVMSLVRIAQVLDGLKKEGLYDRKIDQSLLPESIADYIGRVKDRAEATVWA